MITLMVAVAAMVAAPAVAQSQTPDTPRCEQPCGKQCKGEKKGKKGHKRGGKKARHGKPSARKASQSPAFRGVEMTTTQQAQVDTIFAQEHKVYKAECAKSRQMMTARVDDRVKDVLSPEQYNVYQANKAQMKARKPDGKCKGEGCAKRPHKADKKGLK